MSAGINIDPRNPVGDPPAAALVGFGYARFAYNVSAGTGSQDDALAHGFYAPRIDALLANGITPILVATHQLWGEARGFNWEGMGAGDWDRLIAGYCDMLRRVAARYAGKHVVWQIWNEQDSGSDAAVPVPPAVYGMLLREAFYAVRDADPTARVIVGGLVSGPGTGIAYLRTALQSADALGTKVGTSIHGIGVHLYGVGAAGLYGQFGTVEAQLAQWRAAFPGAPLYVTEFGVLRDDMKKPPEPIDRLATYARAFVAACAGKAQAACWYGWADGMHNGHGVVRDGQIARPLFDALTSAAPTQPTQPPAASSRTYYPVTGLGGTLNVRADPATDAPVVGRLVNGTLVRPLQGVTADGLWTELELSDGVRGWSHTTAAGRLGLDL